MRKKFFFCLWMTETQKREGDDDGENGNEKRENYANEHLVNLHRHQLQSTVKIAKLFHSHSCSLFSQMSFWCYLFFFLFLFSSLYSILHSFFILIMSDEN
jgi:hypothetical protein